MGTCILKTLTESWLALYNFYCYNIYVLSVVTYISKIYIYVIQIDGRYKYTYIYLCEVLIFL